MLDPSTPQMWEIAIVGGCGHVGLPLGIAFATRGANVVLVDRADDKVALVNSGKLPFMESGADEPLARLIGDRIVASSDPRVVANSKVVIVVIGTPVDEHQNPEPHKVIDAIEALVPYLRDHHLLVLRSTIYPGTTALVEKLLERNSLAIDVAFCPERIAEGKAMVELFKLPQIVSARNDRAIQRSSELFGRLTEQIVVLSPEEAELAKLFTNTWRYIRFATANQLFMMAQDFGVSYERIRRGISEGYPRAKDLPGAGYTAGPCLLKDTLQLAAFNNNDFVLGQAAISVNEGFPLYVVSQMERRFEKLSELTVGLLGMAFKGESDDTRSSLSYKIKRILRYRAGAVLCTDPYVTSDKELYPLDIVLERSDVLVIGAPHEVYAELTTQLPIVDVWCLRGEESGL